MGLLSDPEPLKARYKEEREKERIDRKLEGGPTAVIRTTDSGSQDG